VHPSRLDRQGREHGEPRHLHRVRLGDAILDRVDPFLVDDILIFEGDRGAQQRIELAAAGIVGQSGTQRTADRVKHVALAGRDRAPDVTDIVRKIGIDAELLQAIGQRDLVLRRRHSGHFHLVLIDASGARSRSIWLTCS
jgi:hypothetical protein